MDCNVNIGTPGNSLKAIRNIMYRRARPCFKIHQRGVQWKQGVVIYMLLYTSLLYNTTPIHCTPLPLHPPVVNTQSRTYHISSTTTTTITICMFIIISSIFIIIINIYIYIYICMYIYIYIYTYIHIGHAGISETLATSGAFPLRGDERLLRLGLDIALLLLLYYAMLLFCYVMLWYNIYYDIRLCYAMLCYVMLCYVLMCYDMIGHVMLCYVMTYDIILYHNILHY